MPAGDPSPPTMRHPPQPRTAAATVMARADAAACEVVELRQYALRPGTRDAFVASFEQLLEPQEATGMRVLGQFRDVDRPDAFVWLRCFPDMDCRREALEAFYSGPVWAAHRDRLNAMMIDSDDVLLLEPAAPEPSLQSLTAPRPPAGTTDEPASRLLVQVCPVTPDGTEEYLRRYHQAITPPVAAAGGRLLPPLRTLHAVNTFPRLPIREGEHVAVTAALLPDPDAVERLRADPAYQAAVATLAALATSDVQHLHLTPAPRSALR